MRTPSFWWRRRPSISAVALWPVSAAWGAVAARRMARPPAYRSRLPVICIGNYTTGGEGKTPTAIAIAEIAVREGLRPGFLTRGYRGSVAGPLLVDPLEMTAERVGDEPLLLARAGPTVVSGERGPGARLLETKDIDLIVMDDGFQSTGLAKDLCLVVADSTAGLGNRLVMPAGPLRAPLRPQLRRTDGLIVIGDGPARAPLASLAARSGKILITARLEPVDPARWAGVRVLAFAGIGRPEKFFASLAAAGASFAGRVAFDDHHLPTAAEAGSLLTHAEGGTIRLVTTEKDMARLAGRTGILAELRAKAEAFPVRLRFEAPDLVRELIVKLVSRRGSAPAM